VTILSLRAGRFAVDLAPSAGGSIIRFMRDGVDLLRPADAAAIASGTGSNSSAYPLVPFSNRIANGHLAFDGREVHLEANWPGVRHPMHGDGWSHTWEVVRSDVQSAEIAYAHDGRTGWPFRYRARQIYRLDESGLTVTMAIDNLESFAVPAGLGLHPFFVRDDDSQLRCRTQAVWRADAEGLPIERIAVPREWNFSTPRPVAGVVLDNCFDGWDGQATIIWPRRRLCVELTASEPFRHVVIYAPADQAYFCVEPVSHANGQIARTRLAANSALEGEIVFRPFTL